jgi:hypothetical protein
VAHDDENPLQWPSDDSGIRLPGIPGPEIPRTPVVQELQRKVVDTTANVQDRLADVTPEDRARLKVATGRLLRFLSLGKLPAGPLGYNVAAIASLLVFYAFAITGVVRIDSSDSSGPSAQPVDSAVPVAPDESSDPSSDTPVRAEHPKSAAQTRRELDRLSRQIAANARAVKKRRAAEIAARTPVTTPVPYLPGGTTP